MRTPTSTPLIELDERGRPWVIGTNTKVIEIVLDHVAWGWDCERIVAEYDHLSPDHVNAALGWYYNHKADMDAAIAEQERWVDDFFARQPESPLRAKLRAMRDQQ